MVVTGKTQALQKHSRDLQCHHQIWQRLPLSLPDLHSLLTIPPEHYKMAQSHGLRAAVIEGTFALLCLQLGFLAESRPTMQVCNSAGPKVDCGFVGIDQNSCERKDCCWSPATAAATAASGQPWCFHTNAGLSEYELVSTNDTDVGWEGLLRNLTSTQSELGSDITSLTATADTSHSDVVHISITDLHNERWHVPASLFSNSGIASGHKGQQQKQAAVYDLTYESTPFSFAVTRKGAKSDSPVFSTAGRRLVFKDQYIELNTAIDPNSSLFGLEERTASMGLRLQRGGSALPLWNHDTLAANADTNLYGSHPFVMELRPGTMSLSCICKIQSDSCCSQIALPVG